MNQPWQQGQYGPQQPQPGWYPQQPQQGWYGQQPPPPPPRRPVGLWVGLSVAIVLVAALGVTGFVAPGFFLGKEGGGPDPAAACVRPGDSAEAEAVGRAVVDCINAKKTDVLTAVLCSPSGEASRLVNNVGQIERVTTTRTASASDSEFWVIVEITSRGRTETLSIVLAKPSGRWCWKKLDSGSGPRSVVSTPTSTSTSGSATTGNDIKVSKRKAPTDPTRCSTVVTAEQVTAATGHTAKAAADSTADRCLFEVGAGSGYRGSVNVTLTRKPDKDAERGEMSGNTTFRLWRGAVCDFTVALDPDKQPPGAFLTVSAVFPTEAESCGAARPIAQAVFDRLPDA